jgi:hypothetical protein
MVSISGFKCGVVEIIIARIDQIYKNNFHNEVYQML